MAQIDLFPSGMVSVNYEHLTNRDDDGALFRWHHVVNYGQALRFVRSAGDGVRAWITAPGERRRA